MSCACVLSLAMGESVVTFRRENPFTTGRRIVKVCWCKVVIICRHVRDGGGRGKGSDENGQRWKLSLCELGTGSQCVIGLRREIQSAGQNRVLFFTAMAPPLRRVTRDHVDVVESMQIGLCLCLVGPKFDKPSPKHGGRSWPANVLFFLLKSQGGSENILLHVL